MRIYVLCHVNASLPPVRHFTPLPPLLVHLLQVHAQDTSGDTALHRAARNNLYVAYRMLVAGGALEGARNHMRETPGGLIKDSPAL